MLQVTLRVVGGDLESTEVPLQLPAVIGRGSDVSVDLSHPLVSRRHCELRDKQGHLWVRDLDSLNGTFVGSERVVEATLRPGELLTVGTVTFRAVYELHASRELAPAAGSERKTLEFDDLPQLSEEDDTVRSEPSSQGHDVRREATSANSQR